MSKFPSAAISVSARLRPLYIAAFLQGFVFWYAIEKLFLHQIGISDAGIAIIVVVFTAVMTIANLPLGVLADRWSRRGVLLVATFCLVGASLFDGMSHTFTTYLIGSCLWGIYYAAYMGTYDAIIYDVLTEQNGSAAGFEKYYGAIQLTDGSALVIASLLCSPLVHWVDLRGVYFLTVPFSCLAIVALLKFQEPKIHLATDRVQLLTHLHAIVKAVLFRAETIEITLCLILVTVIARVALEFDQLWLIALFLPLAFYGPVNALLLLGYGAGGWFSKHIVTLKFATLGIGLLMSLASIAMLYHSLWLTVFALFILIAGTTILEVILGRWLHDSLSSNIRAGASSAVVTLGYACFLPIGLLLGYISRTYTIFTASWILIVCSLGLSTVLGYMLYRPGRSKYGTV